MSAKWGIFGKSFNDISNAISGKISDINKLRFEKDVKLLLKTQFPHLLKNLCE